MLRRRPRSDRLRRGRLDEGREGGSAAEKAKADAAAKAEKEAAAAEKAKADAAAKAEKAAAKKDIAGRRRAMRPRRRPRLSARRGSGEEGGAATEAERERSAAELLARKKALDAERYATAGVPNAADLYEQIKLAAPGGGKAE